MRRFTPQEDQFLRDNYLTIPAKRMAKMLGRSVSTARQRMKILEVVVPPEVAEKFRLASQFKPGDAPFNKGKKQEEYMSKEAIRRSSVSRFKKGNKPCNTKEGVGHISIRRDTKSGLLYKYIKLADSNWQPFHKIIYEAEHGVIPDGMVLFFKDRNQLNCTLENLELISLAENLRRNSQWQYPHELRMAIRTLNKLNKKIKHREKQN